MKKLLYLIIIVSFYSCDSFYSDRIDTESSLIVIKIEEISRNQTVYTITDYDKNRNNTFKLKFTDSLDKFRIGDTLYFTK